MNETIQEAREAGLAVLQPSTRDMEHGLELHTESLVIDSYGFAPRAAVAGTTLKEEMEAGASEEELRDLTEDMMMTRPATSADERAEFEAAWEAAGVTCILQNAGEEGQAPLRLIRRLARFTYLVDMLPEFFHRATRPNDIRTARQERKRCLYFTGNGVPLTERWVSREDELRFIRLFFQLGVRMMHLTYNRRNMIGDGCAEPANAGLSDFGRHVIAEMNRQGVIVDVAHSGWRTSLEAAQVSTRPMVASHSVCGALNPHCRSKPDEVIRAIADTGGYVGICCIPAFLGGTGDLNALLDHVDYLVKTVGADHVAIGTDTAYTSRNAAAERALVPPRPGTRPRWENFWPPDDALHKPVSDRQVKSLAWTNWPLFTVGMVQRGHSDDDICKILGGNVLRVAEAVLPS